MGVKKKIKKIKKKTKNNDLRSLYIPSPEIANYVDITDTDSIYENTYSLKIIKNRACLFGCYLYLWNKKKLFVEKVFYITRGNAIALSHIIETVIKS